MQKYAMTACLVLAVVAVIAYILMGIGVIQPGNLDTEEGMPSFYYIIPAGYLVIGILCLLKRRGLWIILAVINAFTILVFYAMYAAQPDVMLSAPGLITKIAQILLEICLIYLIVTFKREKTA